MHEIIRLNDLTVLFLKSAIETEGRFSLCEFTVAPQGTSLLPHFHPNMDEMIFGMDGISLWSVGSEIINVGPGERLFIPRGVPHVFANRQAYPTRFACMYTPALLGPELFRELATALHLPAALRDVEIGLVMHRYHTIPVTAV